jgi:hypothetical protein
MMILASRRLLIACLAVAGSAALSIGCSSDNTTKPDASGSGGKGGAGDASSGAGGAGVDAGPPVVNFLFDTNDTATMKWSLNTYADTSSRNLAANYAVDGGVLPFDAAVLADGGTNVRAPTIAFDSTVGNPNPGSLKITVTFTDYKQYVDPFVVLNPTADLTNKILHGKLQVTSGTFSGGAQLHVQTGADYAGYTSGAFALASAGSFATASIDMATATSATATPLNPAISIAIGIQIFSGDAPTTGVPYANAGQQVVFNIDTITD